MTSELKIPYNKVDFVWISDHYDIHLEGICKHNNELCRFITDYDSLICTLSSLTSWEKIQWLRQKWFFEI